MSAEIATSRVESSPKVTGRVKYTGDLDASGYLHVAFVPATIASGCVVSMHAGTARRFSGVAAIYTVGDAPAIGDVPFLRLLQDDRVHFHGQPIGLVLADTVDAARAAARQVRAVYDAEPPRVGIRAGLSDAVVAPPLSSGPAVSLRGDPDAAFLKAKVRIERCYTTPAHNHNPMEPHAALIRWTEDCLEIDVSTQTLFMARESMAAAAVVPIANVRVRCQFLGGGFGSKGRGFWPVLALAVVAARAAGRSVRLELRRPEMFALVARRQMTRHVIRLGADAEGKLEAIDHDCIAQTAAFAEYSDPNAVVSRTLYACPNVRTTHRLLRTNEPPANPMRSPGESPGSFALESALDELATELRIDPLELRRRNFASFDQDANRPWSSNALQQCYDVASVSFGWAARKRGSLETGMYRGFGMASARYPTHVASAAVNLSLQPNGVLRVSCGTQDIGTGTATILGDLVALELNWPRQDIVAEWGDTALPPGPPSVGSMATASLAPAIRMACSSFSEELFALGLNIEIMRKMLKTGKELPSVEASGASDPSKANTGVSSNAYGAIFVEVVVDSFTGTISLKRITAAYAAGRVINPTLARSQYSGGLIFGIGMALHEETLNDPTTGAILNPSLANYMIPVAADMPNFDLHLVDDVDTLAPTAGVKGVGMIGAVGISAAIANAVFDALGVRIRDLPITPAKIIESLERSATR